MSTNEHLLQGVLLEVWDVALHIEEQLLDDCWKAEQRNQCHRIYQSVN